MHFERCLYIVFLDNLFQRQSEMLYFYKKLLEISCRAVFSPFIQFVRLFDDVLCCRVLTLCT